MEISITIIGFVVAFLCFFSFIMGIGLAFILMARDKNLVRMDEHHVVVDRAFLDQVLDSSKRQKAGMKSRYDSKIPAQDFEDDE